MATEDGTAPDAHRCSCGATFESTEQLLEHAREEHGLFVG
jgi:hypothetical protein